MNKLQKQLKVSPTFYNFAATAPILKEAYKEMRRWEKENLQPLSSHFGKWLSCLEQTRSQIAHLIGAESDEITWMPNTSTALSTVAASIRWEKGDKVLFLSDEFSSNRYAWQNLEEVENVVITATPTKTFLSQLHEHDLSGVRLVALSAISYLDGRLFPIKEIAAFCHARNILICVDAIQAVGAIAIDVKEWDCDFLASGGQKWLLGPTGSGFLYLKKNLLNSLKVPCVGWGSMQAPGNFESPIIFTNSARRFEAAMPPIGPVAGLGKSLEILSRYGWNEIFEEIRKNREALESYFQDSIFKSGAEPLGGGIITVIKPADVPFRYQATHRLHTVRFSLHAFSEFPKMMIHPKRRKKTSPIQSFPFRNALVTGATQGLGFSIASALAQRGCNLTLLGRSWPKLEESAHIFVKKYGIKCDFIATDLAELSGLPTKEFDLIINNAVEAYCEPFAQESEEALRRCFEINFFAPWKVLKKYVHSMKGGVVLNVGAASGRCALPYFSTYHATKAALWALTEALGRELDHLKVMTFIPPHMTTQTALLLGRKAFGFFRYRSSKSYSTDYVAEKVILALLEKKEFVCPFFTRLKLSINQLFPHFISKRISQFQIAKSRG